MEESTLHAPDLGEQAKKRSQESALFPENEDLYSADSSDILPFVSQLSLSFQTYSLVQGTIDSYKECENLK